MSVRTNGKSQASEIQGDQGEKLSHVNRAGILTDIQEGAVEGALSANQSIELLRTLASRKSAVTHGKKHRNSAFRNAPASIILRTPVYAGLNDFDRYRTAQQRWLKQEIQRPKFRSAPFRVAIAHIPLVWHDYSQIGLFCPDGKAKWHDLLVEAKINLIISGHTHKHTWFPVGEKAPYAQLIGGGPKLEIATLIQGRADAHEMRITVQNLDGKEIDAYKFQSPA
jgi:hypothetical protein